MARVTVNGFLTAIGPGNAIITATYQTTSGTADVVVSPVLLSTTIASCGIISSPGMYVVTADIQQLPLFGPCVQFQSGSVQLDCRNHIVSSFWLSNVNGAMITNCTVLDGFTVERSTNVTIQNNKLPMLVLASGSGNHVLQNTFDGKYDGSGGPVGQDDGIVLADEQNDIVEDNTIQNVFDAGIEGTDVVANSTIRNNTIVNAGVAGISSYWCTHWTGNVISGNSVSRSFWLVDFFYEVSPNKCANVSTPGAFADNQIIGNRLTDRLPLGGSMNFGFSTLGAGTVSNNLLQGNDLGGAPGPQVIPASGFINGGGNICAPGTSDYCGGLALRHR